MTISLPHLSAAPLRSISVVPMPMATARAIRAASMASMDAASMVSIDAASMASMDSIHAAAMDAPIGPGSMRTMIALLSLVPAPRTDLPLPAGARNPLQSPTAAPVRAPR